MTALPPNIIFVMPDQLRPDFLGYTGASFVQTPHLDRLAEQSLVFERAVSPSPICIPARASLLTGHNALSTGVLTNNYWLRPDHDSCGMPTFATRLQQQGYHTEAIGKMHFIPWDRSEGFTHRWIAEDKRHLHIQDDYAAYLAAHGLRKLAGPEEPEYQEGRMASISPIPLEHQVDVWIGDRAVEFLQQPPEQPFFLWVAFAGPHDPYNPPQEVVDTIQDRDVPGALPLTEDVARFRPGFVQSHLTGSAQADFREFPEAAKVRIRRHYVGLIEIIDQQIGRLLDAVASLPDDRETVIVFASDHGDFLGDFDLVGKALFYEPSLRIPLLICGSAYTPGRSPALVSLTDLFATFLELASASGSAQDSVPLPHNADAASRTHLLGATGVGLMLLQEQWKLSRYKNGLVTLHDLNTDPHEQHNRYGDPALRDPQQDLEAALFRHLMQGLAEGHQEKSYPYMTLTPDHPGHQRHWSRPYPTDTWSRTQPGVDGWHQAGMPL